MITNDNYFSLDNKGLSQSKIKAYLQCPNYFYRSCISGTLKREFKKAFAIGDAVDGILTRATEKDNYAVCENDGRTKAGKEERANLEFNGKTVISRADFDAIIDIADAVERTDAYKEIASTFTFQEIIEVPMELGEHFSALYGKLDAYRINEDGVCDLLDVKTSVTVDERKYFYKFFSLGYHIQLFFYSMLLKSKYAEKIKSFRFYHLAVEKTEPYNVKLFSIPLGNVMECETLVMETINKIAQDTTFEKANPSFINPTLLGSYADAVPVSVGDWSDGNNNEDF